MPPGNRAQKGLQVGLTGQALDAERHLKEGNCSALESAHMSLLTARDLVDITHCTNKPTAGEESSAAQMAEPIQHEDLCQCVLAWRISS